MNADRTASPSPRSAVNAVPFARTGGSVVISRGSDLLRPPFAVVKAKLEPSEGIRVQPVSMSAIVASTCSVV